MQHFKAPMLAAVAALALSGCSWLPFGAGGTHAKASHGAYGPAYGQDAYGAAYGQGAYGQQAYGQAGGFGAAHDPCMIPAANYPVPQGCDPSLVTIGTNGFSQQPQFAAGGHHTTGGYGSHAGAAHGAHKAASAPRLRKPRLRGQLSLGVEKSVSGDYLDYSKIGAFDPAVAYDPDVYAEALGPSLITDNMDGTSTARFNEYSSIVERVNQPNIAYDDVYSTPLTVSGGLEYIVTPKATVFANAGYGYSEGNGGQAVVIDGILTQQEIDVTFDNTTGAEISTIPVTTQSRLPNIDNIANYEFDFTDLRRIDLEAGGRYYFNSLKSAGLPKVTPFVSAAAGASHHNAQSFNITQNQAYNRVSYDNLINGVAPGVVRYEVVPANINGASRVDLYDSQWVPRGRLNAGLEWQATPQTAIAFETGVNVQGGKKYLPTGERGDANISIPLTIRGSYNF